MAPVAASPLVSSLRAQLEAGTLASGIRSVREVLLQSLTPEEQGTFDTVLRNANLSSPPEEINRTYGADKRPLTDAWVAAQGYLLAAVIVDSKMEDGNKTHTADSVEMFKALVDLIAERTQVTISYAEELPEKDLSTLRNALQKVPEKAAKGPFSSGLRNGAAAVRSGRPF